MGLPKGKMQPHLDLATVTLWMQRAMLNLNEAALFTLQLGLSKFLNLNLEF